MQVIQGFLQKLSGGAAEFQIPSATPTMQSCGKGNLGRVQIDLALEIQVEGICRAAPELTLYRIHGIGTDMGSMCHNFQEGTTEIEI
jgi:hypothetical protein